MYESNLKAQWDYENSIAFAEEKAAEKAEHKKALKIATELIKEGSSNAFVAKVTELPVEEIEKLRVSTRFE